MKIGFYCRRVRWILSAVTVVFVFTFLGSWSYFEQNKDSDGIDSCVTPMFMPGTSQPRVLCLILTTADRTDRLSAVNSTWARRCDKYLFIVGKRLKSINKTKQMNLLNDSNIAEVDVTESRQFLPLKVKRALELVYHKYNGSYDWILKCDDDTYVIMENLKLFLKDLDANESSYVGFRMKPHVQNGYMSGGAGYLISSTALRDVMKYGNQTKECQIHTGDEDVIMGKCFQKCGVRIIDSWDRDGKERFHPEPLKDHVYPQYPLWLNRYAWRKPVFGPGCCSRHSITFHHLTPKDMFLYEQLLYHIDIPKTEMRHS